VRLVNIEGTAVPSIVFVTFTCTRRNSLNIVLRGLDSVQLQSIVLTVKLSFGYHYLLIFVSFKLSGHT